MRYYLCILLFMLSYSIINAQPVQMVYPNPGLYVGISGGGNFLSGTLQENSDFTLVLSGTPVNEIHLDLHDTLFQRNGFAGFLLGYNFIATNRISLGIEGRILYHKGSHKQTSSMQEQITGLQLRSTSMLDENWPVDILLKPGISLSDSNLLYVVVGIESQKFKGTSQINFFNPIEIDEEVVGELRGNGSSFASHRKIAPIIGIGMQQALSNHFHLRFEYDYINYGQVLRSATNTVPIISSLPFFQTLITGSNVRTSFLAKPVNDRIMVSLIYEFG